MLGMPFQEGKDVSIGHPRRNETETWCEKFIVHANEWQDIRVFKLPPYERLFIAILRIFERCYTNGRRLIVPS